MFFPLPAKIKAENLWFLFIYWQLMNFWWLILVLGVLKKKKKGCRSWAQASAPFPPWHLSSWRRRCLLRWWLQWAAEVSVLLLLSSRSPSSPHALTLLFGFCHFSEVSFHSSARNTSGGVRFWRRVSSAGELQLACIQQHGPLTEVFSQRRSPHSQAAPKHLQTAPSAIPDPVISGGG